MHQIGNQLYGVRPSLPNGASVSQVNDKNENMNEKSKVRGRGVRSAHPTVTYLHGYRLMTVGFNYRKRTGKRQKRGGGKTSARYPQERETRNNLVNQTRESLRDAHQRGEGKTM